MTVLLSVIVTLWSGKCGLPLPQSKTPGSAPDWDHIYISSNSGAKKSIQGQARLFDRSAVPLFSYNAPKEHYEYITPHNNIRKTSNEQVRTDLTSIRARLSASCARLSCKQDARWQILINFLQLWSPTLCIQSFRITIKVEYGSISICYGFRDKTTLVAGQTK